MNEIAIDFETLKKLWSGSTANDRCQHDSEIWIDLSGIVHIVCKKCGLYGMTSLEGARQLGWIE